MYYHLHINSYCRVGWYGAHAWGQYFIYSGLRLTNTRLQPTYTLELVELLLVIGGRPTRGRGAKGMLEEEEELGPAIDAVEEVL